jgi:hypothetical protein
MYVAPRWCQLSILTFVLVADFRFQIHLGNLGARALPLEFVFRIICLAFFSFFPFSLGVAWNDFLECPLHGAVRNPKVLSPMMLYNTVTSKLWHKSSSQSPFHSQNHPTSK